MEQLNFPGYAFYVRGEGRSQEIFDAITQKYIALTPEEWVRQHLVRYLVAEKEVPVGLMRREVGFWLRHAWLRADVVVYDRAGEPVLVAECKAPAVALDQSTFDQVGRYNKKLHARYLVVTNGRLHFFCRIHGQGYTFLDDVPSYIQMCDHGSLT